MEQMRLRVQGLLRRAVAHVAFLNRQLWGTEMDMCEQLLVGSMLHCVKSLATKVDALSLTPEARMAEKRKQHLQFALCCPHMHHGMHPPPHSKCKNNEKYIGLGQKALVCMCLDPPSGSLW